MVEHYLAMCKSNPDWIICEKIIFDLLKLEVKCSAVSLCNGKGQNMCFIDILVWKLYGFVCMFTRP